MIIKQIFKDIDATKHSVTKILQCGTNLKVIAIGFIKNIGIEKEIHPYLTNTRESNCLPPQPKWVKENLVTEIFDIRPVIKTNKSPMRPIFEKAESLDSGRILKIITTCVPSPITDILETKEYACWSKRENNIVATYITKK